MDGRAAEHGISSFPARHETTDKPIFERRWAFFIFVDEEYEMAGITPANLSPQLAVPAFSSRTSPGNSSIEPQPEKQPLEEKKLSVSDKLRIEQLNKADKAIHMHEQAHMMAAGAFIQGSAVYEYVQGPDGKNYAVHGKVAIDTARELDPKDTIAKMRIVRSAATAPESPSPADLRIASNASAKIVDARQELRRSLLQEAEVAYRKAQGSLKKANESQMEISKKLFDQQIEAGKRENPGPATKPSNNNEPPAHYAINTAAMQMSNLASYQYSGLDIVV